MSGNTIRYEHPTIGIMSFTYDTSTQLTEIVISAADGTPLHTFSVNLKQSYALKQGITASQDIFSIM